MLEKFSQVQKGLIYFSFIEPLLPSSRTNKSRIFLFQISVSTVSTRRFSRAGTPSSILSSDSDIRFTRKLGGQYRCGCCVLAAFLLFLLFSGVSIYLGCKYNTRVSDYLPLRGIERSSSRIVRFPTLIIS